MATFDVARLEGGQFRWKSKRVKSAGGEIVFILHHPTQAEMALAAELGGIKYSEAKGDLELPEVPGISKRTMTVIESEKAKVPLAYLCIDDIEGLDGWPEEPRKKLVDDIHTLTDEARAMLPEIILREIAEELQRAAFLSEEEGKL